MITKEEAVNKINILLSQLYPNSTMRVNYVEDHDWGWIFDFEDQSTRKDVYYGSSVYYVHKNGYCNTYNELAWDIKVGHDLRSKGAVEKHFLELADESK